MTTSTAEPSRALAPFRVATFKSLWLANVASNFGGLIQGVGAAWLMTSLSDSANMVALVQASTTLPIMAFSLMSGAIADNYVRRNVMLAAQLFMFAASIGLAVCAWFGLLTPWLLLGFTFLIGCGVAFNNPAWQATVGDIVPKHDIPAAVLLNGISFNVTRSVGPAIGGAIVATAGAASAFAVNALSYLGLLTVLLRWRPTTPSRTLPRENLRTAMTTGIRYVALSPNIVRVMLRGFLFGVGAVVVLALLPIVARHLMAGSAFVYGALLGAFGIGAVAGGFIATPARERFSNETLARWAFLAFAGCSALTSVSVNPWLTGAALIIGGGAWVMALALFNTTVQMSTPRWVVGRALSLYQMAIFGGMALGSWIWGMVAEAQTAETALLIAAGGLVVGAAIGLWIPLPSRENLNLDPLNRWQEPQTTLDILPRSGPVAVSVEYEIKHKDVKAFLDAMGQRQVIRRRNGAKQWTLMRDMMQPLIWVESFELPTWVDYVRFHTRTTHADAPISDRIRALHSGAQPPKVRRMLIRNTKPSRVDPAAHEAADVT